MPVRPQPHSTPHAMTAWHFLSSSLCAVVFNEVGDGGKQVQRKHWQCVYCDMINKGGHSVERLLSHLLGERLGITHCSPCSAVRTENRGGACGSSFSCRGSSSSSSRGSTSSIGTIRRRRRRRRRRRNNRGGNNRPLWYCLRVRLWRV